VTAGTEGRAHAERGVAGNRREERRRAHAGAEHTILHLRERFARDSQEIVGGSSNVVGAAADPAVCRRAVQKKGADARARSAGAGAAIAIRTTTNRRIYFRFGLIWNS
jgi:hypothetical protein